MKLDPPRVPWRAGDDIASIVARNAAELSGRVALVQGSRTLTWAELDLRVDQVARALGASGSGPGHKVAILAANSIPYVEVFLGALRAGSCVVPLPTMASPESLERMLADSGATSLFLADELRPLGQTIARERVTLRVGLDFEGDGFRGYATFSDEATARSPAASITPDDPFDVFYSSGTTGVPKGVLHSHGARKASYAGSRSRYFDRESVNIIATPFYSNTTSVTWLLATAQGGSNVLLGKFSADAFFDAVELHRVTHAMLVPVQYDRILGSPRFGRADLSSLRYVFSTSAPLRADVKRRIIDETPAELVEIYGLTEGGPVTVLEARRRPDKLTSVGQPAPDCDVRIVDEAGRELPPGQVGEVVGRSANLMSGYLNRPEDTEAVLFRDGAGTLYLRTGDLGRFDEEGFLYLLDRKKDIIISGGFNVYATDLEGVLAQHPAVQEVAVIGIPSDRWGETPLALVVPRPGVEIAAGELREYCNARLGKAQRVSEVELRGELPKNAIGKILKRQLRAPYWPQPKTSY
jgi:acyl-CoA synthetase (AMP-forming)/AMP-acid ligase II